MKIAILTNCTATSTKTALPELTGEALGNGFTHKQAAIEWNKRILAAKKESERIKARALYAGISFRTILHASDLIKNADPDVFVVSAGMGLISVEDEINSYNLNFLPKNLSTSSLQNVITEEVFNPIRWWENINYVRYQKSNPIAELIETGGYDLILIALTNNYLGLVSADIACALPSSNFNNVRIICTKQALNSFKYVRHFTKAGVILPYEKKLNKLLPGNRNDFAQRACIHFIKEIFSKNDYNMDIALHVEEVTKAMQEDEDVNNDMFISYIKEMHSDETVTELADAYTAFCIEFGDMLNYTRFKIMWETLKDTTYTADTMDAALYVMEGLSLNMLDSRREDAIPGLKLFIHTFKIHGGNTFTVKDVCNWAKLYYTHIKEDIPGIFESTGKLGKMLPTISNELGIKKITTNALTGNKYEIL